MSEELKPDFGDYCSIEQHRFGAPNEMYLYKVIGRSQSNCWVDVPVRHQNNEETLHPEISEVVSCICCGVRETKVERFRLSDVQPPENSFWGAKSQSRATAQEGMREALWAAQVFIEDEYRDPSLEPEGEWLAKEARAIHSKICVALSAPAEPAGQKGPDFAAYCDAVPSPFDKDVRCAEPAGRELMEEASALFETLEEYFEPRADAEYFTDSPSPHPNKEMSLLCEVRATLSKLRTALGEK